MNAGQNRGCEQDIAAKPDIGLLADRDQAGIARQQIPQARQRDIGEDFRAQAQIIAARESGQRGQHDDSCSKSGAADPARPARMLDAEGRGHFGLPLTLVSSGTSPAAAPPEWRADMTFNPEPMDERREALVEAVAREIRLRGLTGPAVHFLEASRPYRPLGAPAMLFFDPVLRELFGGQTPSASELLRDDVGIEALIDRLEDLDEPDTWDA